MDLEKIVFNKKQPTKRGTIIKNLLIIFFILIVLLVFVFVGLGQLGRALNSEELKEVKTILNKQYATSDIVQFDLGGLDGANLKNKLTASMNADGLYEGDVLKGDVLFNNATIKQSVELDKKDLTLITREYIKYIIGLETEDISKVFDIKNVILTTTGTTTNVRIVAKLNLSDLSTGGGLDIGLLTTKGLPEYIYVTFLGVIDNTKTLRKCLTSSSIIVNNLSTEDNTKVLEYFLQKYNTEIDISKLSQSVMQYYLNTLHAILSVWNCSAQFGGDGLVLNI